MSEPAVVALTIHISKTERRELVLRTTDVPQEAVSNFIHTYKLSPHHHTFLTQQVYLHLQKLLEEEIRHLEESPIMEFPSEMNYSMSRVESYSNAGERLYQRGKILQERSSLRKKHLKEMLEQEQGKSLTFKPKINKNSLALVSNPSSVKRQQSISVLKHNILTEEQQSCTFAPRLNPKSIRIQESKGRSTDRFEELYKEANARRKKQEMAEEQFYREEYSFKPSIRSSEHSLNLSQSMSQFQFTERLLNSRKVTEEQLHLQRTKQNALVDESTGQKLFKPMTGRAPRFNRNSQNLPVGDYLYTHPKKSTEVEEKPKNEATVNSRSEKILLNIKIQKYFEIFQCLADPQGNLQGDSINSEMLEDNVRRVIAPLIEEIQSYSKPLNFEEFVEAMENLMQTLSVSDKSMFYTRKRKEKEEETKSVRVGVFDGKNMYERHLKKAKDAEERLKQVKEERIEKELSECSFRPSITQYSRDISRYYF